MLFDLPSMTWIQWMRVPCYTLVLALLASLSATVSSNDDSRTDDRDDVRSVVYIDGHSLDGDNRNGSRRMRDEHVLPRIELFRQSVLLAARDELGATTRDYWLGESVVDDSQVVRPVLRANRESSLIPVSCSIAIQQGDAEGDELAFERVFFEPYGGSLPTHLELLERASRSSFVTALQKAGVRGQRNKWTEDAPVPESVRQQLRRATITSQFFAVRELHRIIRAEGESLPRLAALVQGYINLSFLTESYLHPMHGVFQARALLYAQRFSVNSPLFPNEGFGLNLVPATFALTGYHGVSSTMPVAPTPSEQANPRWLALRKPYIEYDLEAFQQLEEDAELGPWPNLYALADLSYCRREDQFLDKQRDLIQRYPDCYRLPTTYVYPRLSHAVPILEAAMATQGPLAYKQLAAVEDLPESVARVVQQGNATAAKDGPAERKIRHELIALLTRADGCGSPDADPHEMSWQALGGMMRELNWTLVVKRAFAMSLSHGEDYDTNDQWLDRCEPLLHDHDLWPALQAYRSGERGREAVARLERKEAVPQQRMHRDGFHEAPLLFLAGQKSEVHITKALGIRRGRYSDAENVRDAFWMAEHARLAYRPYGIDYDDALTCSPFNPVGRCAHLASAERFDEDAIDLWWDRHTDTPSVRRALALWLAKHGQDDQAFERLTQLRETIVDYQVYRALAECYAERGDATHMVSTIREFLEKSPEATADEKANLALLAGNFFASRGRADEAIAWFDRGASGSLNGLLATALAHELRGDTERAVATHRRRALHNHYATMDWLWACLRMGTDASAAKEAAWRCCREFEQASMRQASPAVMAFRPLYGVSRYACDNDPTRRRELLRRLASGDGHEGMRKLLLAVELGDARVRDATVVELVQKGNRRQLRDSDRYLADLARLFLRDAKDKSLGDITGEDVDTLLTDLKGRSRIGALYYLGKYLALAGHEQRAIEYWREAASLPDLHSFNRTLAIYELTERGQSVAKPL